MTSTLRLFAISACLTMGLFCVGAKAQPALYPTKPIRMIVPFPAGGPTDVLARTVGQQLAASLGQPVVIDNRAGANTIIGADLVAKAPADGYTLLMAIDNTLVMNQYLYTKLPYNPLKDFEPVGKVAVAPLIVVTNKDGPASMRQLLDDAAAKPDSVSYGYGTFTSQLGGELIKRTRTLGMLGVSYKGSAGTVQGLLSNDVNFIIDGVTTALPHIQDGRFKALANLGSKNIPTLAKLPKLSDEKGLAGFDVAVWMGLVAPKGTPRAVVETLNRQLKKILESPEVIQKLEGLGLLPDYSSAERLGEFMRSESARWHEVIEQADIKIQ